MKKKIQYCSDIHLEFNQTQLKENWLNTTGDILILAGDSCVWNNEFKHHPFWKWCSEHYELTLICLGNHEFYSKELTVEETYDNFEIELFSNVKIMNNKSIKIENIEIFITTLWTQLDSKYLEIIQKSFNDFKRIKWFKNENDNRKKYEDAFSVCSNWLIQSVKESKSEIKIIVTHHCPILIESKRENKTFNSCFQTDMSHFIKSNSINYWIYGHDHWNKNDIELNNCLITCNQLGYIFRNENEGFNSNKILPIKSNCFIM